MSKDAVELSTERTPNLNKTLDVCTLDPTYNQIIWQRSLLCSHCERPVGYFFENYFDCSNNHLTEQQPSFVKRVVEYAFDCDGIVDTAATNGSKSPPKRNVEALIDRFPEHIPILLPQFVPMPGHPTKQLAKYATKLAESGDMTLMLFALALQHQIGQEFEILFARITIVADFIMPPMNGEVKKQQLKTLGDKNSPERQKYDEIMNKAVLGPAEYLAMLNEKANNLQSHQLTYWKPDKSAKKMKGLPDGMQAIIRTRNAIAHTRDESGCERRFLLRLFSQYFGNGNPSNAVQLLDKCIQKGFDPKKLS